MIAPPELCARGERPQPSWDGRGLLASAFSSWLVQHRTFADVTRGLTRGSTYSSQKLLRIRRNSFAKEMDARVEPRVEPAHDNLIKVSTGGKCSSILRVNEPA
jgi:hypothetical protein